MQLLPSGDDSDVVLTEVIDGGVSTPENEYGSPPTKDATEDGAW